MNNCRDDSRIFGCGISVRSDSLSKMRMMLMSSMIKEVGFEAPTYPLLANALDKMLIYQIVKQSSQPHS